MEKAVMHFAFIIDDYLPKSTRVGAKMFHELATEFVKNGHQVTVITPNVDHSMKTLEVDSIDGVNIWRFPSGEIKNVGKIKRAINESLMSIKAWKSISEKLDKSTFDGVVYYSPSIFFGTLVAKIKRRCGCKSYLVLRDLFPQWAIDAKLIAKYSPITLYFRVFEYINYKVADCIGLMSQKNLELFQNIQPRFDRTKVLYNWASDSPVMSHSDKNSIRKRLNLENEVIFFYGGNIGIAQDMTNLMRLAKELNAFPEAHFLFIGQGDEFELINSLADKWELKNTTILPSISQSEFKHVLSEVDVGLFSLSKKHTAHNFPGKLLGYMVESIPILGSVNEGNDLQNIINEAGAGCILVNGQDEQLSEQAKLLLQNKEMRLKQGAAANKLLRDSFAVNAAYEKIFCALK